ncbi:hypothetical protein [Nocardioides sp.]|uniref:hypothetical protein n=1 Tax=Nocardioides sp. TaxID=35761 RepID=UPI002B267FB9|nr:hypothetical protein [Nocardioides sp.]
MLDLHLRHRQETAISTSTALTDALTALAAAAQVPRREGAPTTSWRWSVRQRMTTVRDALMQATSATDDGWLAARGGVAFRERNVLLGRLGDLGTEVLENPDVDQVQSLVLRLAHDISHHLQKVHDLAYDDVELELGGSE